MSIAVTEFISLDGVVQAPGGPEEDRDGGFAHGGWSHPFFDPEVMGPAWTTRCPAPTPSSTDAAPGRAWPRRGPGAPATPSPTG